MDFLKKVMKCFLFMFLLVCLLEVTSFIFIPKNNLAEFGMEQVTANGILGEKENTIELLVLGDSESYTSIMPLKLFQSYGITSYVCGTPGQRLYDSYKFLNAALENQHPKMVILETNAIFRRYNIMSAIQAKSKLVFPVIKYHDRWKKLSLNDFNGDINYTWTDEHKGYYVSDNINASFNPDYMQFTEAEKSIPKLNYLYVENIKKICDEQGIKFLLLSTPSSKNWNYEKHNGIKKMADNLNINYIDLNLEPKVAIDWNNDTRDKGDHLNNYGALKVTNYLGAYLDSLKLFTNYLDDDNYRDWVNNANKNVSKY